MATCMTAVILLGCSAPAALPSGAITVPTDENLVSSAESGILCTASAVIPPVVGVLEGDPSDVAWPVRLRADDGRRMYILWPRGFSVRFDPSATLLDEAGATFLHAGDPLVLGQVGADPAHGTKDRPYLARGLMGGAVSHAWERCYQHKP
jgi:hypothetical protein